MEWAARCHPSSLDLCVADLVEPRSQELEGVSCARRRRGYSPLYAACRPSNPLGRRLTHSTWCWPRILLRCVTLSPQSAWKCLRRKVQLFFVTKSVCIKGGSARKTKKRVTCERLGRAFEAFWRARTRTHTHTHAHKHTRPFCSGGRCFVAGRALKTSSYLFSQHMFHVRD